MKIQQENTSLEAPHARLHTLLDTDKNLHAQQPVLASNVGFDLDPGIRRRYRPNEDTLVVTHGVMPSALSSTEQQSFVLLLVADGMGGQAHGREASQLAA